MNKYKFSDKKKGKTNQRIFETGIPNTDVLGMQSVNQATSDKVHSSNPPINKETKTGKNKLKTQVF